MHSVLKLQTEYFLSLDVCFKIVSTTILMFQEKLEQTQTFLLECNLFVTYSCYVKRILLKV